MRAMAPGKPNERTMYELPGARRRLVALLRSGGALPGEAPVGSHMLASSCELAGGVAPGPPPTSYHACRPGTGLFNVVPPPLHRITSVVPTGVVWTHR